MQLPASSPCYPAPVTVRLGLALVGALCTLGCADMLGLGGLSFDQEASGGSAALASGGVPGAVGGASGGVGSGGVGSGGASGGAPGSGGEIAVPGSGGRAQPPPSIADEYPITLRLGGQLVVTWPGVGPDPLPDNSTFWVYSAEAGTLSTHHLDTLLPDAQGDSEVPTTWDLLYAPHLKGVTWLCGYDAATGFLDSGLPPLPGGEFAGDRRGGSGGWTHILLAGDPRSPFVIAADSTSRIVRIGPADPDAEDAQVTSITWEAPFTELVPFRRGATDGVLRLDSALGAADFVPIEEGAFGQGVSLELDPPKDWSLAISYSSEHGSGLLLYYADDGEAYAYQPTALDTYELESVLWPRGVTDLASVRADDEPWALTYDAETGVTDVRFLDPLEEDVVVK